MFRWVPGQGFDKDALARLAAAFPKPREPMGEAWFMGGERRMFNNLLGDLNDVCVWDLIEALGEISSGMSCFGPEPDWVEWYPYLLSRLIPRSHEDYVSYLLESLISGFFTQYPDGMAEKPYPGFRDDVMNTLGRCMMDRACWVDDKIVIGTILHTGEWPNGKWGWFDASGDFSASMFFCLKYLAAEEIDGWVKSVLAIACPQWRAQLIAWFVGAHRVLIGDAKQPADFFYDRQPAGLPEIDWEDCQSLDGDYSDSPTKHTNKIDPGHFLPEVNRTQTIATVRAVMTQDLMLEWLISMRDFPYLKAELLHLPEEFLELYPAT